MLHDKTSTEVQHCSATFDWARTVPPRVYSSRLQLLAALVTEAGGLVETTPFIFYNSFGYGISVHDLHDLHDDKLL